MEKSRTLPRSLQISEMLIREIASGLLPDGTRLPTERQMADDYDVAVGTLRKALAVLEMQGLLERVQGSGNYVRKKGGVDSIYAQFHLERPEGGGLPSANIISIKKENSPAEAIAFGFANKACRIDRLRMLDNVPIALERIWLNGTYTMELDAVDISESLYKYYQDTFGLVISHVEDSIGVGKFPTWAPMPHFQSGQTVGYIVRRAWSQSSEPAEYSQTWFDPSKARYINRIDSSDS